MRTQPKYKARALVNIIHGYPSYQGIDFRVGRTFWDKDRKDWMYGLQFDTPEKIGKSLGIWIPEYALQPIQEGK